ncbi:hypothetical protein MKEN_00981900 [Mycena kentingensis (nom. inval.)]|nr:hypothetical protein MKEN_00981900 [Mycena kentingensis (nom. inval.)]
MSKRASDASSAAPRKRTKAAPDFTDAKGLVDAGLTDELSATDARKVVEYVRWLEEKVEGAKPKEKSPEEVAGKADKLRNACVSGIKKQLTWKASCKTGSAKWSYDGACTDPVVFAAVLGLDAPPKWKMHKYTVNEFEDIMGSIEGSTRYDTLALMGSVNVRYQAEEGTFKMSGSYGAPRHVNK